MSKKIVEATRNGSGPRSAKPNRNETQRGFSPPQSRETRRIAPAPWKLQNPLPPLTPEEYAGLKESIRDAGVLVPIIVDPEGNIVDGNHREQACKELKIFCPREVRTFASEEEKSQTAIGLNINRRHLTGKQRQELIARYLKADPAINDRHLGEIVKVSKNTVAKERRKLEESGQIDQLDKRRGRDGKLRPAKHKRIIANTAKEAEKALVAIKNLPASCEGKILDAGTATRRANRNVVKQEWQGQVVVPSAAEDIRLYNCRFQDLEAAAAIAPAAVHAIITDILYDGPFLPQVSELAEFAKRVLVPGGLLVTLSGQLYVNDVMKRLGEHLDWGWMGASIWDGDGTLVHPRQVMSQWKPLLVFSNGNWKKQGMWPDVVRVNSKEKDWHPMQQPLEEAESLVRYFSQPGDLIVNACGGGFTIGVACRNLGRRFIGCDVSAECVSRGQARLAGLSPTDWAENDKK